nr:hypothetical protein BaRGS_009076 [Batillaria attramentaria]
MEDNEDGAVEDLDINTCLRRIFNIRWPEKIRNEELWERAGQEPLAKQILRRKQSLGDCKPSLAFVDRPSALCEKPQFDSWRTQALEDDGSQHLVVADGAPQHEAGPAPGVVFHDTVVSIAVTSSSPYPNTPVGMVNAETAFIAEKHVLPANIVPVEVALRPLQACLSMVRTGPLAGRQFLSPLERSRRLAVCLEMGAWCVPYNSSGCFCHLF